MATVALVLTFGTTACAFTADNGEKRAVTDAVTALPDDVVTALRLGKVDKRYWGEVGQHVDAERVVGLTVPAPTATTAGTWTASCQTVVTALASTGARLYGRLPHDSGGQWYEGTSELCQRGLGLNDDDRNSDALRIGVRRGATTMIDTAANYDPGRHSVIIRGTRAQQQGQTVPIEQITPADVDHRLSPTTLPWRYSTAAPNTDTTVPVSLAHTIVVPAGTTLRITASCAGLPDVSLKFDVTTTESRIHHIGGSPEDFRPDERPNLVTCNGQVLSRQPRPQWSYRSTITGQAVDQYAIEYEPGQSYLRRGDRSLRTITIEVLR